MKKLLIVLVVILLSSLYASKTYSQYAFCQNSARHASCRAVGQAQLANGVWYLTCPTGALRYNMYAECSTGDYIAEVVMMTQVYSNAISANSQTTYVSDQGSFSNLNPNNSYAVDLHTRTDGPAGSIATAYVSVDTW